MNVEPKKRWTVVTLVAGLALLALAQGCAGGFRASKSGGGPAKIFGSVGASVPLGGGGR